MYLTGSDKTFVGKLLQMHTKTKEFEAVRKSADLFMVKVGKFAVFFFSSSFVQSRVPFLVLTTKFVLQNFHKLLLHRLTSF